MCWYPISLPAYYEGATQGSPQGAGRTLEMNSNAIRFACERELPVGLVVRVAVEWPVKLSDGTSLSLWAIGRILRSAEWGAEVTVDRHEFRTRRTERTNALITANATAGPAG